MIFSGTFISLGLKIALEDGHFRILQEDATPKFLPLVEQVTFLGARADQLGQSVLYVRARCISELTAAGLKLFQAAPASMLNAIS